MQIKIINHKNPSQAEEIRRISFDAYRVEAQLLELAEANFFPLGRTAAQIQAAEALFLGCFLKENLVAVTEIEAKGPQHINIGSFIVAPEMFRKGLGTALLKDVLARYPGFFLTVSTAEKNVPAINLYEKHGFAVQRTWHTPDGIKMVTLSTMNDTRTLKYESLLLGTTDQSTELPLIIPLHFMGSIPTQICDILLSNVDFSARVIAPYGQFPFEDQFSWFPEELYDKPEPEQGKFVDNCVDILLENVANWKQNYPTQGQPIFLGVSQGGDICFSLAASFGDQFSLCLPIAGRLLRDELIKQPNSGIVRVHHGADDSIVPIATAREATTRLQSAGMDAQLREYAGVTHAVPAEMQQEIHDDIRSILKIMI